MRYCCALAVSLCGFTGVARGDDLLQLLASPFYTGPGGAFTIKPVSGNSPGQTGMPADLSLDTFETFCMQADENISPGSIYSFVINTGVPFEGGFDPLDDRSAYLYTYFREGILPGFDYGAGRAQSTADLQRALWFIEDESLGVNNAFVAQANAAVGVGGVWEGMGLGNVRVLNLFSPEGVPAQDQLTIIPAQGSTVLIALAAGLLIRHRRR